MTTNVTDGLVNIVIPCHNDGDKALRTVRAVDRLKRTISYALDGIIVDDASSDGSVALLRAALPSWATVISTPENMGRAGALNYGVEATHGNWLLILDADCIPGTHDFLARHLDALATADVSVGDVKGIAGGFWGRYQSAAARRRRRPDRNGEPAPYRLTSANVMLSRETFDSVSGFDTRYRRYGFEDRDFFLRLHERGASLQYNPDAPVVHSDAIDLSSVYRKMRECGCYSAPLFRAAHPYAYRELGYAAIDANLHPYLRLPGMALGSLLANTTDRVERSLQQTFWPYTLRAGLARFACAIAYLNGTCLSSIVARQSR